MKKVIIAAVLAAVGAGAFATTSNVTVNVKGTVVEATCAVTVGGRDTTEIKLDTLTSTALNEAKVAGVIEFGSKPLTFDLPYGCDNVKVSISGARAQDSGYLIDSNLSQVGFQISSDEGTSNTSTLHDKRTLNYKVKYNLKAAGDAITERGHVGASVPFVFNYN